MDVHALEMFDIIPLWDECANFFSSLLMLQDEAKRQLLAAGFKLLNENDDRDLQPGDRYSSSRGLIFMISSHCFPC
jgi:hypothetical protein